MTNREKRTKKIGIGLVLLAAGTAAGAAAYWETILPGLEQFGGKWFSASAESEENGHNDEHDEHGEEDHHREDDQDEAGHHHEKKPVDEIILSLRAAENFGIDEAALQTVEARNYSRRFEIPAVLEELPGLSHIQIPAPATGVITRIYPESGTAVAPNEPLFEIQLNSPALIAAQNDYLTLKKNAWINQQERDRLGNLDPGIAPQKQREILFEQERLATEIAGKRGMLSLLGLTGEQIEESLDACGEMIKQITVYAPDFADNSAQAAFRIPPNTPSDTPSDVPSDVSSDTPSEIPSADVPSDVPPNPPSGGTLATFEKLAVDVGQQVEQGDSLAQICRMNRLVVKGKLFAADEQRVREAIRKKAPAVLFFDDAESEDQTSCREKVTGLTIRSMENEVGSDGVIFCCADLANEPSVIESGRDAGGGTRRYIQWRYRPGRRCTLAIPYEEIPNCIVLPGSAVAYDIGEAVVFEKIGVEEGKIIWKKRPVSVIAQTKEEAVLANDGSLTPGTSVAGCGADFLLSALEASERKAASGGGIQHGDHVH